MESGINTSNNNVQLSLVLSVNDVLKDAQRISEFRGDNSYALSSFLREVDTVLSLIESNAEASNYIFNRIILNKLQGEALHVIRSLGPNPIWNETKKALIQNFGVRESFHQLFQEAFGAKNNGIVSYYTHLLSILCKINEKYEYDSEKPIEFSPEHAEKIILRTFINNIDVNLASVVINRNISKLRDAYNLLEEQGLIRINVQTQFNNNHSPKYTNQTQHTQNSTISRGGMKYRNLVQNRPSGSYMSNSSYNNYNPYYNKQNLSFQNLPNAYYNNNNSMQRKSTQHNTQYQKSNDMEIDHINSGVHCENKREDHLNFHLTASKRHFQ